LQGRDAADSIVASVGEVTVFERDLDDWWQSHDAPTYSRARQDLYEGRRKALDALLGDVLLQREAAARGTTTDALLAEQIPKYLTEVGEDEIQQAYQRSLPLPGGVTFNQVKPMVAAYLHQQHVDAARLRYVDELRRTQHVIVRLAPPRQRIAEITEDPSSGSVAAEIQIVEFADFECPYCRQLEPVLRQLRAKYGDRLRLVWKDFPLAIHDRAHAAAEAARCAADQGRFWEFHDRLFENQQALDADGLRRHARDAGLDEPKFLGCLEQGTHRGEIAADQEEGARHGVEATPTLFINGRPIIGAQPLDAYERLIAEEQR